MKQEGITCNRDHCERCCQDNCSGCGVLELTKEEAGSLLTFAEFEAYPIHGSMALTYRG